MTRALIPADAMAALEAYRDREVAKAQKAAWVEGLRNAADGIQSFRATEGVLDQQTLDLCAELLRGIADRALIPEVKP